MSELQIRKATPADGAALEDLQRNSFTQLAARHYDAAQVAAFLGHACNGVDVLLRRAEVWLIGDDAAVVACAAWHPAGMLSLSGRGRREFGTAEVRSVYVRDGWTRRGLAGRLLDHVETEAARSGVLRMRLDAMRGSEPFYLSRGYAPAGPVAFDLGGVRFPGLAMSKALARRQAA